MDLIQAGDLAAAGALYADDFILHYPGRNPLAGTYTDIEEFLSKLERLFEGGTVTRELHDALGTDDHAVQLIAVQAEAQGRSHSWQAVVVMHVGDGKFSEAWFHFHDQHALDEYLTSLEPSAR
jgi:hypothetical protein